VVIFRILFSEPVTGVDLTDFQLNVTGAKAIIANLLGVSSVGDGSTWDVSASIAGTGPGTVGITVLNNGSILDLAGQPLSGGPFTSFANYSISAPSGGDGDGDGDGFPPAPPGSPIAGPFGLAALAAGIAAGGAMMLRRRKKS
jgi:hypothetical protein